MLENLIEDFAHSLGHWAYLFVAVMATAETAAFLGFIAPGEFTIILGGVLAGEGTLSVQLLIGIVWASIVLGDSIGFMLGRRLGRSFVIKHGPRVRLKAEHLDRVDAYFKRHGGKTIFFGRWVGFVRPLMPFTAGTTGMPYRRFLPYDVISAGLFGTTFTLLGYVFWNNFEQVTSIAGRGALGLGFLVALLIAGRWAWKNLRDPERRRVLAERFERLERRPLTRPFALALRWLWVGLMRPLWRWLVRPLHRYVLAPVWAWLRPPLRFLGNRLMPGELGIELTTLVAVAAVSLYAFIAYTDVVSGPGLVITPGDDKAREIARDIESGTLTALAKVASAPGILAVGAAAAALGAGVLAWFRRFGGAIVLVVGFALSQVALYTTKAAVDRPRPGDALVDTSGSSFPSGHAAVSIVFVAVAVGLARVVRSRTAAIALTIAGIVVAALVGLSRVYLRAHYLSDVTAGWALALAVYSLCGSVALVVFYLREYLRGRDREPGAAQALGTPDGR